MTSSLRPSLSLPTPAPLPPPEGFAERVAELGITLDASVLERLGAYLALLLAMNEQMNLTAIKAPAEAWDKHIFDALNLVALLADHPPMARIADVGSGGGIPGLVIAIARPDLQVTLIEATQKKAAFLVAAAAALGLAHVTVYAERAEVLVTGVLRSSFDVVVARAVAPLVKLLPLTAPFARPDGLVLAVKGQRAAEELAEAAGMLGRQRCAHVCTLVTSTARIVMLKRGLDAPARRPARR